MSAGIGAIIIVLVVVALGIVLYRMTTPSFVVGLVAAAFKAVIPALLKSSPHSKEYWDTLHERDMATSRTARQNLDDKLKEIEAKERSR